MRVELARCPGRASASRTVGCTPSGIGSARGARAGSSSGRRARRPEEGQSTTVNSVSCIPSGARRRTLWSFHGVTTGSASCSAPAATSRAATGSLSSTSKATRTGPATRAADLDLVDRCRLRLVHELECRARLRRGATPRAPRLRPPTSPAPAGRACRGRTRVRGRSRRPSGRGGAPYRAILPDEDHPCARSEAPPPSGATTASNVPAGTAARTSPARCRARSRYAGSGSTTTTSKPASRSGVAWMPGEAELEHARGRLAELLEDPRRRARGERRRQPHSLAEGGDRPDAERGRAEREDAVTNGRRRERRPPHARFR